MLLSSFALAILSRVKYEQVLVVRFFMGERQGIAQKGVRATQAKKKKQLEMGSNG